MSRISNDSGFRDRQVVGGCDRKGPALKCLLNYLYVHKGLLERPKRGQYKRSSLCARLPRASVSESEKIVSDCPKVQNVVQAAETKGTGVSDYVSDNPQLSEALSESVSEVESVNFHRFGQLDSKRREAGHDDLGTAG